MSNTQNLIDRLIEEKDGYLSECEVIWGKIKLEDDHLDVTYKYRNYFHSRYLKGKAEALDEVIKMLKDQTKEQNNGKF